MSTPPPVTVLMAVHDGAAHVGAAVESVVAQTYADFELLVIDDGSADGSADIVLGVGDARVRVVRNQRNLGLTRSLNIGLALARGDLVARHDADDLSHPERLAVQVAYLHAHPATALAGSWYRKIDRAGESLGDRSLPLEHARLRWALLFYCPFVHSAVLFRRREVTELGGYDERFVYAQDYDLWSRLARHHRVANVGEVLVEYRQGPTTMTATVGERTDEVLAIAGRNIADVGAPTPSAEDHRAMGALVTANASRITPDDVGRTVQLVMGVLDRFCASAALDAGEIALVRDDVGRSAAEVVLAHAARLTDADYLGARDRLTAAAPQAAMALPASRRTAVLRAAMRGLLPDGLKGGVVR